MQKIILAARKDPETLRWFSVNNVKKSKEGHNIWPGSQQQHKFTDTEARVYIKTLIKKVVKKVKAEGDKDEAKEPEDEAYKKESKKYTQ